jgi:cytochrome c-type biogenesis protein
VGADLALSFAAGFASVISPCVLPLVPGYLSTVTAIEPSRLGDHALVRRVIVRSVPFIVGFTVVFVLLGVLTASIVELLGVTLQKEIAGFVMIVIGLAFIGLLPVPNRLLAPGLLSGARGTGSALLLGAAFATCAAPCIAPWLTGILLLASDSETVARGATLLAAYSLGLAAAFLLAGIFFARAMATFRWLRDRYQLVTAAGGVVLVAFGALLFFDRFWWLQVGMNRVLGPFGLGV